MTSESKFCTTQWFFQLCTFLLRYENVDHYYNQSSDTIT
jgi:hypothetical protein